MYDLPTDFDLKQFVARSLELVCFGTWKTDLSFSGGYMIEVEDVMSFNDDAPIKPPELLTFLYPLINQEVTAAIRKESSIISFTFTNGTVLHIHDSHKQFECYHITLKGQTLARV